ncbi:MAG: response regulator transcription factor [Anaerolineales bacterium]|jgi:two-component system KDP operon response regulator KdpE
MISRGRILVVDDEPKLIRLVKEILLATGYEVLTAGFGQQAIEMVALEQPDLVLLDIMLPDGMDGYDVARRLREFSDIPIIMLTAKIREADMLRGFDCGVDDYIKKPFSSKELLARMRAVLKRAYAEGKSKVETEIVCGHLRIDLLRRKAVIDDHEIHLSPTEYNLLHELAVHPNQVLFHEQLLSAVWGAEYRDDIDYLRSYIHILRKKLEADPSNPEIILSSPGVGYMLASPEAETKRN